MSYLQFHKHSIFCIASNIPDFPVNPVILSKNPFLD
jgi:hypothetical protein